MLILDEPTIGLDPRQIAEIRALIRSLAGQHTVILSTHILPEVSMVCDGVVIINRGRIVAQGTESELVQQVFPSARIELRVAGADGDLASAVRRDPGRGGGGAARAPRRRRGRCWWSRRATATCGATWSASSPASGWTLQELHQVGMSLEEVFIRVVAGEEQEPHEPVLTAVEETP